MVGKHWHRLRLARERLQVRKNLLDYIDLIFIVPPAVPYTTIRPLRLPYYGRINGLTVPSGCKFFSIRLRYTAVHWQASVRSQNSAKHFQLFVWCTSWPSHLCHRTVTLCHIYVTFRDRGHIYHVFCHTFVTVGHICHTLWQGAKQLAPFLTQPADFSDCQISELGPAGI